MHPILLATALILGPVQPNAAIHQPAGPDLTPGPRGLIRCATPAVSRDEADAVQSQLRTFALRRTDQAFRLTIPVAFHVITCNGQGNVPQSQIDAQIRELNSAYRGSGFSFVLSSVDRTESCQWFSQLTGSGVEKKAKQALAIDPAHHLNVYTADLGHNLLGWSYFPQSFPEDSYLHGVVIHFGTLPGGFLAPYDLGGTLDHESGHYLGLFHTFQGGCTAPGDYIDDTPFEASPAFGCPIGRNTCPQPGDDPIRNYMDYTDDACYSEFTGDQAARMQAIVQAYRPSLFGAALAQAGTVPAAAAQQVARADGAAPGLAFRGVWPNPFSQATTLGFALPRSGPVSLKLYNVAGEQAAVLVDGVLPAGEQTIALRAGALRPGMYFAALRYGGEVVTRSVILLP